jgi:GntR family transcriptional regulator
MPEPRLSIRFRLDLSNGIAPYRQLVAQVQKAVSRGVLREGDQLPSIRDVVNHVTINPNTVQRAYRELEYLGIAKGRAGLGTFITTIAPVVSSRADRESLLQDLRAWTQTARNLGLNDREIQDLVDDALVHEAAAKT